MKDNKILLLLFLLVIPTFVLAADKCDVSSVRIKGIKPLDIYQKAEEVEEATFDAQSVRINANFYELEDSIQYQITIENNSSEDFVIDDNMITANSNYFDYSLSFPDDSTVIKAGKEKKVLLNVSYVNEVPSNAFQDGLFPEEKYLAFSLSNEDRQSNPLTSPNFVIAIAALTFCVGVTFITKKRSQKYMAIIIGLFILPYCVDALCVTSIAVHSNVTVSQCKYHFLTEEGSFSLDEDVKEICVPDVVDNGYEYLMPSGHCSSNCSQSSIWVSARDFTDESYIKVFDNNHQLIDTITNDKLPVDIYSVSSGNFVRDLGKTFIYDSYPISVEVSDDLLEYDDSVYNIAPYTGEHSYANAYSGPWVTDFMSLQKIRILRSKVSCLEGFEKIDEYTYLAVTECVPR